MFDNRPAIRRGPRDKWVEWLRDPSHTQTQGTLCRINADGKSYCCLGGACEAAIADGVPIITAVVGDDDGNDRGLSFNEATGTLPHAAVKWLFGDDGLVFDDLHNPVLTEDGKEAATLNDGYHWSFARIADAIMALPLQEEGL